MNFYLPFSRFWELAVGSALSHRELNSKLSNGGSFRRVPPMVGLFLVACSILFFDTETPHPSFHTIIPVLGVALIIVGASKADLVGRLLGSKPFVWIGLISYSVYLWHFPIFAFSRMGKESSNYDKFWWIVLTLILSAISYLFVESVFRDRRMVKSRTFFGLVVVLSMVLGSFLFLSIATEGFKYRLEGTIAESMTDVEWLKLRYPAIQPINTTAFNRDPENIDTSCYKRRAVDGCIFGEIEFITLGDSFVGALEPTLLKELSGRGIGLQTNQYPQCAYLSEKYEINKKINLPCFEINRERDEYYSSLSEGKTFVVFHSPSSFRNMASHNQNLNDVEMRWKDHFEQLIKLTQYGHRVVFVYGIPQPRVNSRSFLSELIEMEYGGPTMFGRQTKHDVQVAYGFVIEQLKKVESNRSFISVDASDVLCESGGKQRCFDFKKGLGPLFNNGSHLSYLGAQLVVRQILSKLKID